MLLRGRLHGGRRRRGPSRSRPSPVQHLQPGCIGCGWRVHPHRPPASPVGASLGAAGGRGASGGGHPRDRRRGRFGLSGGAGPV